MQGLLVLLDVGEATYLFVEAVVGRVVVALAHFAHHDFALSGFAIEAMVKVLLHADALSRMQDNLSARLHDVFYAVYATVNRSLGELLVLVGIVKLDDEVAATAIDDVLHLRPMEVHRRLLKLVHYHNLLSLRSLIDTILAVSDGEEEEAHDLNLEDLSVSELKELAKNKGIKGYSKMNKEELIDELQD